MLKNLILVVEDDPAIQFGLRMALESRGYDVVIANDGQEGLDILEHCDPSLILADIRMPVLNGLEMLLRIKLSESLRHIPVVMISASPGDQATALDSGASFFLRKPFDHSTLFEIVDSCLMRSIDLPAKHANGCHEINGILIDSEKPVPKPDLRGGVPMPSLEILMIDDDKDFASMIEGFLVRDGHRVTVIYNWLSLLRQVKKQKPDLLLVDIETPTGNGVTAMEFLAMDPAVAGIPMAFVTGVSDPETRRRCETLGAGYLHKSGDIPGKIRSFLEDEIELPCLL